MFNLCSDDEISESEDYINPTSQLKSSGCMHFLLCPGQCTQMNRKAVESAIRILKKNENIVNDVDDKELLNKRILKIENTLEIILDKLNDLLKK